jgi:hypothetical protein
MALSKSTNALTVFSPDPPLNMVTLRLADFAVLVPRSELGAMKRRFPGRAGQRSQQDLKEKQLWVFGMITSNVFAASNRRNAERFGSSPVSNPRYPAALSLAFLFNCDRGANSDVDSGRKAELAPEK